MSSKRLSSLRARFSRCAARAEGAAYRLGVVSRRADPGVGPLSAAINATLPSRMLILFLGNDMLESPLPDSALTAFGHTLPRFWANPLTNSKRVPHGIALPRLCWSHGRVQAWVIQ